MAVQAQITIAMVENDQQTGATQPVGENHATAVHGTYLSTGRCTDQHAIPLSTSVAAARGSIACYQSAIYRPRQFAACTGERPAVDGAGTDQRAAGRSACRVTRARLLCGQGTLACLLGFARLARQGFFDGLQYAAQLGLFLLARLESLIAAGEVAVELGQRLLAFLTGFGELRVTLIQFGLLRL